ncbi:MAG: YdbL family protein [Proteobacteria bacterium]|nr:YdbL family protein [Pseudomonadota bacterium]MDA1308675.1 YdbL family protein [Pseudomonadota bacterium]
MFQVRYSRRGLILAAALMLALVVSGFGAIAPAQALSLDEAKAQGLIGEQLNGYIGVVPGVANPGAATLVSQINAKRRAAYQDIAKRNAIPVKSVEAVAGRKLVGRVKPGGWFKDPSGKWRRR